MSIIDKKKFFELFFENKNIKPEVQSEIKSFFKNENFNTISENRIKTTIIIELYIKQFKYNFRETLIETLRNDYDQRSWYLFFIDKIDYKPLIKNELPLVVFRQDSYFLKLPIDVELVYMKKNEEVQMFLILLFLENENDINIYAENKYLECKLILTEDQIIESNLSGKQVILHDKKHKKLYKNKDMVNIRLNNFFNNIQENKFGRKISCSGEIIHF